MGGAREAKWSSEGGGGAGLLVSLPADQITAARAPSRTSMMDGGHLHSNATLARLQGDAAQPRGWGGAQQDLV